MPLDANARTVHLIVAVHGILTGRVDPTWPERLERYAAGHWPDTYVLTDHYDAGPLPWWNVFVKNPRAAASLVRTIEAWVEATEDDVRVKVHFVAHSNGCDIVRRAAITLMKRGYAVESLLLFSAPLPRTLAQLGLAEYLLSGELGRFVAYCADEDDVLSRDVDWHYPLTYLGAAMRWPYGNLGRLGVRDSLDWLNGSETPIKSTSATRMFRGWHHGDFFPPLNYGRLTRIFEMIGHDIKKS